MCERGQMTIEFAVAFPVLLAVALIALNALMFMAECAAFDNSFRQLTRVHCASLAAGNTTHDAVAEVLDCLNQEFNEPNIVISLEIEGEDLGYTSFVGTLDFYPTLFGLNFRSSFFGISLWPLQHQESIVLDCYKPGVFI